MLFSVTEITFWYLFFGAVALAGCSYILVGSTNWMITTAIYGVDEGNQRLQKIYECADKSDRLSRLAGLALLALIPVVITAWVTKSGSSMSAEALVVSYLLAVTACATAYRNRRIGPAFKKLSGVSIRKAFRSTGEVPCIR